MFGVCAALFEPCGVAQSARRTKSTYQKVVVISDGASVYQGPSFDSAVVGIMPRGTQMWASKKAIRGTDKLGFFYQVRVRNLSGYVADTDIRTSKVVNEAKRRAREEENAKGEEPIYLTRYVGGAFSLVNYTEKFSGRKLTSSLPVYGLRMTGPGTLFDGPPLDFNFWFTLSHPGYYSRFSSGTPSGFLLFGDVMALFPFLDSGKFVVNYGLGLMYTYTHYNIPVKGENFNSQELRVGVDLGLGVGYRIHKSVLRADIKYYFEKTQYMASLISFQMEY